MSILDLSRSDGHIYVKNNLLNGLEKRYVQHFEEIY